MKYTIFLFNTSEEKKMDIWEKVQTTEKSNPNKQTLTEASNL